MPVISFTANLQRHVKCPTVEVAGQTVGEALQQFFANFPQAQGYVLTEQGALRPHMVIFVNGQPIQDRNHLTDALPQPAEIHVMQALSGG